MPSDSSSDFESPKKRRMDVGNKKVATKRKAPESRTQKKAKKCAVEGSSRKRSRRSTNDKIKTRSSPKSLKDALKDLSMEKKEAVRQMGFGSILELQIETIPAKVAFWVVQHFCSKTCTIKLNRGKEIKITEELVHKVTGFPRGNKEIVITPRARRKCELTIAWKKQFKTQKQDISTPAVLEKVEKLPHANKWWKYHFLVLLVTTLIQSHQNRYFNINDNSVIDHIVLCSLKVICN